jgi:hypothetical protein
MTRDEQYYQRARARRTPSVLLRRRERRIIARRRPDDNDLAQLAALRRELAVRATRPSALVNPAPSWADTTGDWDASAGQHTGCTRRFAHFVRWR